MPSPPPSLLTEWVQPGAVAAVSVGILGLMMTAFRGLEVRLNQRISELREDVKVSEARLREEAKAREARLREEVKAGEARQIEELRAVKAELKAMGGKLDRVLESFLAVKS